MLHPDLAELLDQRMAVIADHAFRDRDSDAHLQALMDVSLKITEWHQSHAGELDPRLEHFLSGCSYEKARRYLESDGGWKGH